MKTPDQTLVDLAPAEPAQSSVRVLLIEDDPAIAETISFALRQAGFEPAWAALGQTGLSAVESLQPSLIILDVGLPDIGGFEVCRRLRLMNNIPVLFLTAHSDEIDRIQGFELGADDYMSKPFSPRELTSRVRAILRRAVPLVNSASTFAGSSVDQTPTYTTHNLQLYSSQARVVVGGQELSLTRTEFKLLEYLMAHPLRVFAREQLLNVTQGAGSPTGDRAIDTHIKTLRAKLLQANMQLDPIKTHRGFGYSYVGNGIGTNHSNHS